MNTDKIVIAYIHTQARHNPERPVGQIIEEIKTFTDMAFMPAVIADDILDDETHEIIREPGEIKSVETPPPLCPEVKKPEEQEKPAPLKAQAKEQQSLTKRQQEFYDMTERLKREGATVTAQSLAEAMDVTEPAARSMLNTLLEKRALESKTVGRQVIFTPIPKVTKCPPPVR